MKALTLIQPWAGLIVAGPKRIENRTWKPPQSMIGERFAIHAGKKLDKDTIIDVLEEEDDRLDECGGPRAVESPLWRVTSAIIGTATYAGAIDCVDAAEFEVGPGQSWWFSGPIGYVLCDVRALAVPVHCKGALGFWTLPADVERAVVAQLSEAA